MSAKSYSLSIRLVAKDAECVIEEKVYKATDLDGVIKILKKKKCTKEHNDDPLVLLRDRKNNEPSWVGFIKQMVPKPSGKPLKISNSSAGAVLVVDKIGNDNRVMILSFGQGHHCIPDEIIDPFFGIKVAVNSIDSEQIRSMNTSIPSSASLRAAIQTGTPTQPEQLALSLDGSILKGITGEVSDEQAENLQYLKGCITGSSSLTLKASITSFDNLKELCLEAYKQFLKDDYTNKGFGWIDQLKLLKKQEVAKAKLNEKLEEALKARMDGGEPSGELHLSPPEIVDYERITSFQLIQKSKNKEGYSHLSIDALINLDIKKLDIDFLKKNKVYAFDNNDELVKTWSIYKCLTFETIDDAKGNTENNDEGNTETYKYILSGGSWYKVDSSFYNKIKGAFTEAVEYGQSDNFQTKELPQIKKNKQNKDPDKLSLEGEKDYNERVAKDSPELICLDGYDILLQDGKFEACDLLSSNQELIHVKKCCSSSTLSHLFMQGRNSTLIFKSDPGTIGQFQEKIDEAIAGSNATTKGNADKFNKIISDNSLSRDAKVIFALIDSRQKGNRGSLPFFSLVTFSEVHKYLRNMNIDVSVLWVTEEETK